MVMKRDYSVAMNVGVTRLVAPRHTQIFCMKIGVGVVCFCPIITFYQFVNIRKKLLLENKTDLYRSQIHDFISNHR